MTLAYDYKGDIRGKMQTIAAYINATANDTTDPVNGPWIDNRDGRIKHISYTILATDKTGTNPTVNAQLKGSNDGGTTAFDVVDSGGTAIATGALDISSADSTNVVHTETTTAEGLEGGYPQLIRVSCDIGGTSTPGGTYVVSLTIERT